MGPSSSLAPETPLVSEPGSNPNLSGAADGPGVPEDKSATLDGAGRTLLFQFRCGAQMVINPPETLLGKLGGAWRFWGTQGLGGDADTDPGRGCY